MSLMLRWSSPNNDVLQEDQGAWDGDEKVEMSEDLLKMKKAVYAKEMLKEQEKQLIQSKKTLAVEWNFVFCIAVVHQVGQLTLSTIFLHNDVQGCIFFRLFLYSYL